MITRPVTPIRWKTLVAVGTAAGLAQGAPLQASVDMGSQMAMPVWVVQASGEAGEGGEGGEAGAVANVSPDVAYMTRLGLVEGHLIAAATLYARGMPDEAVGLAGHPEAEMMDEVRETLATRGAPDFTEQLEEVGTEMADSADDAHVTRAMTALHDAIAKAETAGNVPLRARFDSILALTRAAAAGYAAATEGGTVSDVFGYHESYGFLKVAEAMAATLAGSDDADVAAAAAKVGAALAPAIAVYGDVTRADLPVGDGSVIYGAAAKVELAGLRIR